MSAAASADTAQDRGPFSKVLIAVLVVVGLLTFFAFLLGTAFGGDGGARGAARATVLSRSAIGYHALYQLMERFEPVSQLRRVEELDTPDLLVVALEQDSDRDAFARLLTARIDLPTVVILPKWGVVPDPENLGWVRSLGPFGGSGLDRMLGRDVRVRATNAGPGTQPGGRSGLARTYGLMEGLTSHIPTAPQFVDGDSVEMLATPADGRGATIARIGDGPLYVIADPDLVNNMGMADRENAVNAVRMLRRMMPEGGERIVFDLTTNGVGAGRSLLRTMFEPPFLGLTLALLAAALIAGFHGAVRFGPPRRHVRAIPFGKAALVENSAALVRQAQREAHVGKAYADVVRDEAARVTAAPASLHGPDLDAYLDRFGRKDQPPFSYLAASMRQVSDRGAMMKAARALFSWKKDVIR